MPCVTALDAMLDNPYAPAATATLPAADIAKEAPQVNPAARPVIAPPTAATPAPSQKSLP